MAKSLADLIKIGEEYLGIPYVYGGTTPKGFDCSGYTKYVFKQVGITLPRTSQEQAKAGIAVSAADLSPGDLILSDWGEGPNSHVAIYAGGGKLLEAPRTGKNVQLVPYSSAYKAHTDGYRRVTSKSKGVLTAVTGVSPGAASSTSSSDSGGILSWPGDIIGFFKDGADAVTSATDFLGAFFQPSTYVRIGAGITGMTFLIAGCVFLLLEASQ
jgi:hypothetical protein